MSQKDTKNEVAEEFDCTWEMWIAETRGKKRGQKKRVRERETALTRVAWKLSLKSNFSFTLSGFFFKDLNIFAAVAADGQAQFLPSFLTPSLPPSLTLRLAIPKRATRSSSSVPTKPDPATHYLRRVTLSPALPRTPLACPSIYIPHRLPHLQFPARMPPPMPLYCRSPSCTLAHVGRSH
jgi:hypothetical protein